MFKVGKKSPADLNKEAGKTAFIAVDAKLRVKVSSAISGIKAAPSWVGFVDGVVVPKSGVEIHALRVRARSHRDVAEVTVDALRKAIAAITGAAKKEDKRE